MPGSLTAAIYARVSTADQNYRMQLAEARDYARRMGWTVVEYTEKVSAAGQRPELDRLMEDARLKRIDVVLVWKLDRFGRSVRDLTENILKLDRAGVRFVSITQGIDTDQRNPMSKLVLHIMAAFAEFERGLIAERTSSGKARYAKDYEAGLIGRQGKHSRSGKDLAPHRPLRVFRRDEALRLRQLGRSYRQIAAQLNVPVSTVADAIRRQSAPAQRTESPRSEEVFPDSIHAGCSAACGAAGS
jgi:putative DNA-invertase from lambdoid prophage Rac